jgi:hypothetical protein
MQENETLEAKKRPDRYVSHALVEVKRFKNFPIMAESGVLLDISLAGFKIEFTGRTNSKFGQKYWLQIPLGPLGIIGPSKILCQVEVRWFDPQRQRIGGVFINLSRTHQHIIQQIIETLESKGNLIA